MSGSASGPSEQCPGHPLWSDEILPEDSATNIHINDRSKVVTPASHLGSNNDLVHYRSPRAETIVDSAVGGAQGFGVTPPRNHRDAALHTPSSFPHLLTFPAAHGHGYGYGPGHGEGHGAQATVAPPSSSAYTAQRPYPTATTPSSPFEREFQIGRLGRDTSAMTTAGVRSGISSSPVAADGGEFLSRPLPNSSRLLFPVPAAPAVQGTGRTNIGTLPPLPPPYGDHSTIMDDHHPLQGQRHQLPAAAALSTMAGTQPPVAPSDTTATSIRPSSSLSSALAPRSASHGDGPWPHITSAPQQQQAPDYSFLADRAGASGGGGDGRPSSSPYRRPPPPPSFILQHMPNNTATGTPTQKQQNQQPHSEHQIQPHNQRGQPHRPQLAPEMQKELVTAMSAGIQEAGELAKQRRNLKLGPRNAGPLLHGVDVQIRTLRQRMEDMEERLGQGDGSSWAGWTVSMWEVFFGEDSEREREG